MLLEPSSRFHCDEPTVATTDRIRHKQIISRTVTWIMLVALSLLYDELISHVTAATTTEEGRMGVGLGLVPSLLCCLERASGSMVLHYCTVFAWTISFFVTKNPAPTGEEGRIISAARESWICFHSFPLWKRQII